MLNPKRVYTAYNPIEAEIIAQRLISFGINAEVRDAKLWGAIGLLPVIEPTIWVKSHQEQQALQILSNTNASDEHWDCPDCGESIEGQFSDCWNCAENHEP